MSITTTITWTNLKNQYSDQLSDLEEAHQELKDQITEEFGDDALTRQVPQPSEFADALTDENADLERLAVYKQLASQYEQSKAKLDSHRALLERLEGEYGDGEFEVKMLSGREVMDLETQLRMEANQEDDVDAQVLGMWRNADTVDAAVVDAPEGIPRDEEGSPTPSECPEGLVNALYDQVQKFNSAGDTGFTPRGFDADLGVADPGGQSI